MHYRIGRDDYLGATFADPWDIPAELDNVAEALVGYQQ
jgi:hypothetical protein